MIKTNKKGVFGLTSVQAFFAIILAVALLAYVIVVIMGTLQDADIIPLGTLAGSVINESTSTGVTETGYNLAKESLDGSDCVIGLVTNASNGKIIGQEGNYTNTKCKITALAVDTPLIAGTVINESSIKVVNETGVLLTKSTLKDVACTVTACVNASDGIIIPPANVTLNLTTCRLSFTEGQLSYATYNNTVWNCTYTYTYTSKNFFNNTIWNVSYTYTHNIREVNDANMLLKNTSTGIAGFFSSINPVYAILAILVIILVLVVLVRVVNGGQSSSGGAQETPL